VARATASSAYVCQSCGTAFPRWEGRCRTCGAWNSLVETVVASPGARSRATRSRAVAIPIAAESIAALGAGPVPRQRVGIAEVDRVLGGGLVPGELVLLGGEPGVGKSTLVLQLAASVALADGADTRDVLYATAEESTAQLRLRAARLGLDRGRVADRLAVVAVTGVESIVDAAREMRPALLVVDSIQTVDVEELDGPPGSVGQVREAAARLGSFAREEDVPVLLVSHVTKDGSLAGPRTLEHLVDAVLMLEGDRHSSLRLLRALKNRHGSTDEIGVLEMGGDGLREVPDPTRAFLGDAQAEGPGLAVAAVVEGSRPLLVEIQALVAPAGMGPPRRTLAGIDASRVALIIAVLARRAGVDVGGRDVYAAVTGGLEVEEPAADLAVALAIASSHRDLAISRGTIACGEISLLGEVRPVRGLERCLREAARLGYRRAIVPAEPGTADRSEAGGARSDAVRDVAERGLEVHPVRTLRDALTIGLGGGTGTTG
jgi:DNA repair protein RadA/Sms